MLTLLIVYTIVALFAEVICPDGSCGIGKDDVRATDPHDADAGPLYANRSKWEDIKFKLPENQTTRFWELLGLTRFECDQGRRVLAAMILGALIGCLRSLPATDPARADVCRRQL